MTAFCILVVDDDEDFLSGVIRQLEKKFNHLAIKGALSGPQALAVMEETEVGVMLSDLRMPGMTGHELLQKPLFSTPFCVR